MKALVREICDVIEEQVHKTEGPASIIIKIEDMPHPQVFSEVHAFAYRRCSEPGYRLTCKLARPKFEQFRAMQDPLAQQALSYLLDHNVVDVDNQMTRWRNQPRNQDERALTILMGTETVEDKGGLYDFHLINQTTLSRRLDGNYAQWFDRICWLDSEEAKGLNQILDRVFRHVPEDLFNLSSIADALEQDEKPQNGEELIATLLYRLDKDWDLPRIISVPSARSWDWISRSIDDASRFRNREGFKEQLSYNRLEGIGGKISRYFEEYPELDLSGSLPGYPVYRAFEKDLLDYIRGARVEEVRNKLFACDFSVIREILNMRIRHKRTVEKPTKVHGDPMRAFASAVIHALSEGRDPRMEFTFGKADLADCSNEEELLDAWRKVCMVAGGVLRFLATGLVDRAGNPVIGLKVSSGLPGCRDPFEPREAAKLIERKKVVRASPSKKLSSVKFTVTSGETEESFIWEFEPNSGWVLAFALLTEDFVEKLNEQGTRTLPVWSSPQLHDLIHARSAEEFFDILDIAEVECQNILEHLWKKLPASQNTWIIGEARRLAEKLTLFVNDLWNMGLYSTMLDIDSSSGVSFVQAYCDILKGATHRAFPSVVTEQLHTLVNAFLICPPGLDPDSKGMEAAVVPPIHPAMLEKVQSKAQFMRQGFSEVLLKLVEGRLRKNQALSELEQSEQLSTITSAVDILKHKTSRTYLGCKNVFGAYAVYKDDSYAYTGIQQTLVKKPDVVQDDGFSASEMLAQSPLSRVVSTKILDYVSTFPARLDGLRVAFVNPYDLQPIIAGMHEASRTLNKVARRKLRITLAVLAPMAAATNRRLLDYWLDHFFEEGDQVEIRTYFRTHEGFSSKSFRETMPDVDIVFLHNILETVFVDFERCDDDLPKPSETRFPMVYAPLPASRTSVNRKRCVSQPQFEAARQHSQLIRRLDYEIKGPGLYRVVQEVSLSDATLAMLSLVHEKSRWVVTTDPAIDRDILRRANASIIGFSTGEGPFGELNVTISSTTDVREDIRKRLTDRLRISFSEIPAKQLAEAAEHCLDLASRLDGADILSALNPEDYDLHNFLAHLLTMKHCEQEYPAQDYLIQNLTRLDSYRHWFSRGEDHNQRPDFLLLQVPMDALAADTVPIEATLIECKMGQRFEEYLLKAEDQLERGLAVLSQHWNPESTDTARRYWHAQLYRALVFSNINLSDDSSEYLRLVSKIQKIVQGQFKIEWKRKILAFWLDEATDFISKEPVTCIELGRRSTWRMILPDADRDPSGEVEVADSPLETKGEQGETFPADILRLPPAPPERATRGIEPLVLKERRPVDSQATSTQEVARLRLLIGRDTLTDEPVYWEYGHEKLPNRHLLVTGNSGTGKTYFIQAMLFELSKQGVSSVVFDYTDGFTPNRLEKPFVEYLGPKIVQFSVYNKPFPVNPFTRYDIEVAGQFTKQSHIDVAERLKSVFRAVYDLGEQQANAIYNAVKNGLERRGDAMSLPDLRRELEAISSRIPNARTVLSKIQPLLDRNPFSSSGNGTWDELNMQAGTVFIVQLSGLTRDVQLTLTEIILWDAWYHRIRVGDKSKPFPVILDEAQNLDHSEHSPTAKILTEGRKFGWSGWFAAQFLKGQMKSDEIERLQQASQKVIFNPPETEIPDMASVIEPDHTKAKQWRARLARLQKGECVFSGFAEQSTSFHKLPPRIVKVTSLEDRV
jgi:DNA phosphorothioation-dependent restriction protein DptH